MKFPIGGKQAKGVVMVWIRPISFLVKGNRNSVEPSMLLIVSSNKTANSNSHLQDSSQYMVSIVQCFWMVM